MLLAIVGGGSSEGNAKNALGELKSIVFCHCWRKAGLGTVRANALLARASTAADAKSTPAPQRSNTQPPKPAKGNFRKSLADGNGLCYNSRRLRETRQ